MKQIIFEPDDIDRLEKKFHNLLLNATDPLVGEIIREDAVKLPELQILLTSGNLYGWLPLSGYMGGVQYALQPAIQPATLYVFISSRMSFPGEDEFLYKVTASGHLRLEEKDHKKRFMLFLKHITKYSL